MADDVTDIREASLEALLRASIEVAKQKMARCPRHPEQLRDENLRCVKCWQEAQTLR